MKHWSGWRSEDKEWIDAIFECSRIIADEALRDHVIGIIDKMRQKRIKDACLGNNDGQGGFIGYE